MLPEHQGEKPFCLGRRFRLAAAFLAATSVVMALIARHKSGVGQCIEVPLFNAMFTAIGPAGAYVTERGLREPRPIEISDLVTGTTDWRTPSRHSSTE